MFLDLYPAVLLYNSSLHIPKLQKHRLAVNGEQNNGWQKPRRRQRGRNLRMFCLLCVFVSLFFHWLNNKYFLFVLLLILWKRMDGNTKIPISIFFLILFFSVDSYSSIFYSLLEEGSGVFSFFFPFF